MALRTIVLSFSACLVACAGTAPVVSTDQQVNTGLDPVPPGLDSVAYATEVEPTGGEISPHHQPVPSDPLVWSALSTPESDGGARAAQANSRNVSSLDASPPAEVSDRSLPESTSTAIPELKVPDAGLERSSTNVVYGLEDDESVFVRTTYKGGELFTVGASFTREKQLGDFQMPIEEDRGFWQMRVGSGGAGGPGPDIEAEFAQSSFDPDTSEGFGLSENRLIKLSMKNSWQGFSVGAGYQSVGQDFELGGETASGRKKSSNKPQNKLRKGRQTTEAWVSRQFGNLGVKTAVSMHQDKPDGDENASHFTTHKVGGALNYTISSWPMTGITLDYASGVRGSSNEPNAYQPMEVDVQNLAGSLYYADESWNGTLYVDNAMGEGTKNAANIRTYWLGGSYFPQSNFSITPSVSYVKEEYPEFDVETDSFATSMTVNYRPTARSRFTITGYSEYSTEKNRDWAMDSEYMYSSLGINWDSKKPKSLIKKWSFELFHDHYTDNLYSENNTDGVGFMMKLRSKPSPLRRLTEELR